MHVNNETGVLQPLDEVVDALGTSEAFLHVDSAQGFGKTDGQELRSPRIDLISVSGHKIYGPKGVGALVYKRRGHRRPPLTPVMFGGGQERGLRQGTLAVPLIAGLGVASRAAIANGEAWRTKCLETLGQVEAAIRAAGGRPNGDRSKAVPHILNATIPGLDAEAAMLLLRDEIAISNGSACTSQQYTASHVLSAMGLDQSAIDSSLRIRWSHFSDSVDWDGVVNALAVGASRGNTQHVLSPPAR